MKVRQLVVAGSIAALAIGGAAACGSDEGGRRHPCRAEDGSSITIYSSLPAAGNVPRPVRGRDQRREAGAREPVAPGKVGKYTVNYVSLDDSTAQNPGTADEGQTAQNARKAVQDKSTISYLGEFNSGGTKVSLPILNKAGIPQISPSNTYVGLTTNDPGSEAGEPDKYYPTGKRTYARVVPAGHDPGRRPGPDAQGRRLQDGHAVGRQDDLRRRPGAQRRAVGQARRDHGARIARAPTRTRRTTARSPRASSPTASSGRA